MIQISSLGRAIKKNFPSINSLNFYGEGGQKRIYLATFGARKEILKAILIPSFEGEEDAPLFKKEVVGRTQREINILKKCNIPEIVKLGSISPKSIEVDDEVFIIYSEEFLIGQNLRDIIRDKSYKADEQELKLLFSSLVKAIKELWFSCNVVHRDIKPENIVKTKSKARPFILLDLGIAFATEGTPLTALASTRLPPATFYYIAPEMLQSPDFRRNINYRTDLYAAALTVYEYASKRHPIIARKSADATELLQGALYTMPKPLHQLRADLTKGFCEIIDQCLKKVIVLRPGNLDVLIKEVR